MKRLLYIGNILGKANTNPTSINTLGRLLRAEGFVVKTASDKENKGLRFFSMIFSLFANYQKTNYVLIDTYSTQSFWYAVSISRLCRFMRLPYIPILHGAGLISRLKTSPKLCHKIFRNAEFNVAPSQYLYTAFKEHGYSNIKYIPNSIPLKKYPYEARKKVRPKLFWLRAFDEIFNPKLALQVLEVLLMKYPEATLCMVGPDKDGTLEKCREYALENKLSVQFTGKLEKETWIDFSANYDIFINTTDIDNTPVSVIEAMALGLPVVSTNVGGLPFLIRNNEDGMLVPPNDAKAMAGAVDFLLSNPAKAELIRKQARAKAESFDWALVKNKWLELLC